MRNLFPIIGLLSLGFTLPAAAADGAPLDTAFTLTLERAELDGLSLGDDPSEDRLVEQDFELEIDLRYEVNDHLHLFFIGGLIDETETIESVGREQTLSGLERKEIGATLAFGENVESELTVGRMEFASTGEGWMWWEEELDAIRIESSYRDFEAMLGFAREQARETTDDDFIDPEIDGLERLLASLTWEFGSDQSLQFYYLDQADDSRSFNVGDFEDARKIDEIDADLTWTGISYLGGFDIDEIGEIEVELHRARVSGDETLYEFGDPDMGQVEIEEREEGRVSGTASSLFLGWRPAALGDWRFTLGRVTGSGDGNPDDRRDKSYRQNGLQGEAEIYGELFQPEISNLAIRSFGVEWDGYDGVRLALTRFDYRQEELADEMRDVSIETDPDGLSKNLGSEIDLVATITTVPDLEIIVIFAEFDPGAAYAGNQGDTSRYVAIELDYEF